jgi:glycosyltransferase involved in cell wall biosynthesis
MKFCMVSTFYPPYHFGGDATYLARLVAALARRGHDVDVIHDRDAYHLAHPGAPEGPVAAPPDGVRVHTLSSAARRLAPLVTHQTGRPKAAVRRLLERGGYDVVHFHNASLIGPRAFAFGRALKLYTTHEHWLVCPLSLLWKFDREVCTRRACVSCMIRAKRPPQWWRYTGLLERALPHIDTFISPSRFTREIHRAWGLDLPFEVLPYFVPTPAGDSPAAESPWPRPYFLFVGRLVRIKGLQTILPVMRAYPDADLLIAGDGPDAGELRALAGGSPRIHFLGAQPYERLRALYRHAVALIMPSICYEVCGIVLLEAFVERTPVIVRKLGGMAEVVADSGGGVTFESDHELLSAMRRLQQDRPWRDGLGAAGHDAFTRLWSEGPHIDGYFEILDRARARRRIRA